MNHQEQQQFLLSNEVDQDHDQEQQGTVLQGTVLQDQRGILEENGQAGIVVLEGHEGIVVLEQEQELEHGEANEYEGSEEDSDDELNALLKNCLLQLSLFWGVKTS